MRLELGKLGDRGGGGTSKPQGILLILMYLSVVIT